MFRFPNMYAANISRDSVREALRKGISAEDILHFLQVDSHTAPCAAHACQVHAQPAMTPESHVFSPLPSTLSDQIILWQRERERSVAFTCCCAHCFIASIHQSRRLKARDGILYSNFDSSDKFEVCTAAHPQAHAHMLMLMLSRGWSASARTLGRTCGTIGRTRCSLLPPSSNSRCVGGTFTLRST